MKLQFKINKHYLLVHALRQTDLPFPAWVNLQNRLWKRYPKAFYLLSLHPEVALVGKSPLKELTKTCCEAKKLIQEALKSKEFQRLHRESKDYLSLIKKQWAKNQEKALSILEDLSGLKLPKKNITVLITHPKLRNGFAIPQYNTIGWGHPEDWKNYSTVYLCHEIMHILTSRKAKDYKIMHALIELITDNELRIRLNKKGRYFKEGRFDVSHSYLLNLEKKILPYWRKYLNNRKKRTIFDLEKELINKLK
jgi:hypothetical protein